jgi:hypothetical protein
MGRLSVQSARLLALLVLLVMSGCSTLGVQPQNKAEVMMKNGDVVTLFYSGSKEASALFCLGETVTVYREESRERLRYIEQGKVQISRIIDANHLAAKVVEGKVDPGDLAMKGNVGCLVTPPHQKPTGTIE